MKPQRQRERIVTALPGNGWTMLVNGGKREEVLAFIVVERMANDGVTALSEIRAVPVYAPEIALSPFLDEESSYQLVARKAKSR